MPKQTKKVQIVSPQTIYHEVLFEVLTADYTHISQVATKMRAKINGYDITKSGHKNLNGLAKSLGGKISIQKNNSSYILKKP